MSDEERDSGMIQMEEASQGQITWGRNNRGDLVIDGTVVERGAGIGAEFPLDPPPASQEEVETLRQENDQLREQQELVQAHAKILSDPLMKDILSEYVERGQLEPPRPPPPSSRDVLEYNLRRSDPDFPVVQGILREWAETLPAHEAAALNENHALFVREYDRIKSESGGRLPKARSSPLPASYPSHLVDRRTMETILRSKEVARARVEPPGPAVEYGQQDEGDSRTAWAEYRAQKKRFEHARAFGSPTQIAREEQRLVELHPAFREKKSSRRNELDGY